MSLHSILIPAYNAEPFIEQTIQSCLAQSFPNFELIISDNRSTDATYDVINSIKDSRIRVHRQDKNLGMVGNWNWLLSKAKGDTFQILCADDFLEENFLFETLGVKRPHNVVFTSPTLITDGVHASQSQFRQGRVSTLKYLWRMHGAPLSSIVFSTGDSNDRFDPSLQFNCDFEYLVRCHLARGRDLIHLDQPLVYVNLHDGNETKRYDVKKENIGAIELILKGGLPFWQAQTLIAKRFRLKYL